MNLRQVIEDRLGTQAVEDYMDAAISDRLRDLGIHSLPIDLEKVAESFGIRSVKYMRMSFDGLLRPVDSEHYEVHLSVDASPQRQRFSLAHEIAHAFIHTIVPETRQFATRSLFMQPGNVYEEKLCDSFAARLLMPAAFVKQFSSDRAFSISLILDLATESNSSITAAAIRCREHYSCEAALVRCWAIASEEAAAYQGMLLNFSRKKLRIDSSCCFEPPSIIGQVAKNGGLAEGWQWFQQSHIRRRLWVSAIRPKGRVQSQIIALISNDSCHPLGK